MQSPRPSVEHRLGAYLGSGKEDHVSMGMTGALKLRQITHNLELILAIEMMCAAQGLDYRPPAATQSSRSARPTRLSAMLFRTSTKIAFPLPTLRLSPGFYARA